jgi:hypothetical protein
VAWIFWFKQTNAYFGVESEEEKKVPKVQF